MGIASINPATGLVLKTFEPLSSTQLLEKLDHSKEAYHNYRQSSFIQRRQWLLAVADALEVDDNIQAHAQIMTMEMGKPLREAIAEVKKCAWVCRYYAHQAEVFLSDRMVASDAQDSWVTYQPLGTILAVMPWNFPFWQVFRFAAPSLMAGNVALLKHASNVPQCALRIEEIFRQAGFPPGVFQTLIIDSCQVETVIKHPQVKAVALTGSEPAGASVASIAGSQIKKTVLELGGSDPFIVLPSADIDAAVAMAVQARLLNTGQSCIAAKRFILAEAIAEAFIQKLVRIFESLKIGDPMARDTDIGPLATPSILATLSEQVQRALTVGATRLVGENPPDGQVGNFYPPTILTDIPIDSEIAAEEFFGPVALVFRVPDLSAAIELANSTPFGLGASAWTQEAEECDRLIADLEAGAVFINGMVKSDPRLPFGGIKRSGYGRELGCEGIHEFVNVKTVWISKP